MHRRSRLLVSLAVLVTGALVFVALSRSRDVGWPFGQTPDASEGESHATSDRAASAALKGRRGVPSLAPEPPQPETQAQVDADGPQLSGRVVDDFGRRVPSARVSCYEMSATLGPPDWSVPLGQATSNELGEWHMTLPSRGSTDVSLIARKEGFAGQHAHLQLHSREAIQDLELCLYEAGSLRVRVVGGGRGVRGVRVGCVCAQMLGYPHDRFAVTDGNGEAVFSDLAGQVRVSVQEEDGIQFGVLAHVAAGQETSVKLAMPSFHGIPVSLAFLGATADIPEFVQAYIIAGRAASGFELRTDGTPVTRAIDPAAPVSLRVDLPDSTRWQLKWPDARESLRRRALEVKLPAPSKTLVTVVSDGAPAGLPDYQCELVASDHGLRIPLHTDAAGQVHCTLPRLRYEVLADDRQVGELDFREPTPRSSVHVAGHGLLRGQYDGPLPERGAKLELRVSRNSTDNTRDGEPRHVSRQLTARDWAVPLPWENGTSVSVRLWRARRPLGPSIGVAVGDSGVSLPWFDYAVGQTLELSPRLGERVRLTGVLALISTTPPSESDENPTRVLFSAHVDGTTGTATFEGIPAGTYEVRLSRYMGDRRTLRGVAPLTVKSDDIVREVELKEAD